MGAISPEKNPSQIQNAIRHCFNISDLSMRDILTQGSTAVMALIIDNILYIANAGDSRAVLYMHDKNGENIILTEDHKPNKEREKKRITDAGGLISCVNNIWRIGGVYAVSRSIGDYLDNNNLKITGMIAEPDLHQVELEPCHKFLILASDGLWDVVSSKEATTWVYRIFSIYNANQAQRAAQFIVEKASERGSKDDITAIVIDLRHATK